MSAIRLLDRWTLRAAVIAVIAYCLAARNIELSVLFALGLGLRAFLLRTNRSVAAPAWAVNGVAVLAVLWTLGRALGVGGARLDIDGFSVLLTLLLLGKLFDWSKPRDAAQVLMLSAFLGLGAVLTSNELLVFLALVALGFSLACGTIWFQLAAAERRTGILEETSVRSAEPSPVIARSMRGVLALTLPAVVVVSMVVFVVAPRGLGDGIFGELRSAAAGGQVTGFDDRVQLGAGGVISDSPTIVLDLEVRDIRGERRGGPMERYYLRGAVLDQYDQRTGTWEASPTPTSPFPMRPGRGYTLGTPKDASIIQDITIRAAPNGVSYLFSVWSPVRIEFPRADTLIADASKTHSLRRRGRGGKFSYTVWSSEEVTQRSTGPREDRTRTPLGLPRVRAMAERVVEDFGLEVAQVTEAADEIAAAPLDARYDSNGPVERAIVALSAELRRNFVYTLAPNATPRERDPIEWFLLDEQSGHCEYFASGLVALCRSLGIRARVVQGSIATEFNETTLHYVVRESNAHAWDEAEVAPGIWKTFDATPEADLERIHDPSSNWMAQIGRMFDAVEYAWITSVVGFDEDLRTRLFGAQRSEETGLARSAQRLARRVERQGPALLLSAVINAVLAFGATVGVGWLAMFGVSRLGRRWRPGHDGGAAVHDRLHAALLRALRAAGYEKPPGAPIARFAHAIDAPQVADDARSVARVIYDGKFAGRPPTPAAEADAWRRIESIAGKPDSGR